MATIPEIISRWVDNDGAAIPFSRLYSYSARSSVPKALYSDVECTIPLSNPLVSDASGKFPQFFATSGRYKFALKTAGDVLIDTRDDIEASGNGSVGTVTSVQVTLGAALGAAQHVTTPPVTSSGNINMEFLPQSARYVLIGPTSGTGLPTFRALEVGDIPDLSGRYLPLAGGTMDLTANINFGEVASRYATINEFQYTSKDVTQAWSTADLVSDYSVRRTKLSALTHGTSTEIRSLTSDVTGFSPTITFTQVNGADTYIGSFDPLAWRVSTPKARIIGYVDANADLDISVLSGVGVSTIRLSDQTNSATFGSSAGLNTTIVTTDSILTRTTSATSFEFSRSSACFVGQDFDIRNSKRLLIGGVEAISSARVGSFAGFSSTGGGTITGGKFTLAAATATYASLNIPTRSAAVSSPAAGDIQFDGSSFLFKGSMYSDGFYNTLATAGDANSGFFVRSSGGVARVAVYKDNATESGSDAGSNFCIRLYSDAGNDNGLAVFCSRIAGSPFEVKRPLKTNGTLSTFVPKTSAYTATSGDDVIGISGTTIFNVLLPATAVVGTRYTIKRTDANTTAHTVTAGGTTTIDGATTFTFSTAWQALRVVATATNAYSVI